MFSDIRETFGKFSGIGLLSIWERAKDVSGMMRRFLDFGQFVDPQSLLGAPAVLLVLSLITAVTGTYPSRRRDGGTGTNCGRPAREKETALKISSYYDLTIDETADRAKSVETWPLSWPELGYALRLMLSGLFCYVFYRIAFCLDRLCLCPRDPGKIRGEEGELSAYD